LADQPAPPAPAGDAAVPRLEHSPAQAVRPRTIVVGMGNPVLGDDGVGWRVADEVEARLGAMGATPDGRPAVDVERLGVGGLRLMEFLDGYDTAILVDAAEFPDRPLGEVRSCPLEELDSYAAGHLDSAHDASLVNALALGRRLGASLPGAIHAVTIQVGRTDVFSEQLSPDVEAAVPAAAAIVMALLAVAGTMDVESGTPITDKRPGPQGGR
jgi:hydrogenase maturation protease